MSPSTELVSPPAHDDRHRADPGRRHWIAGVASASSSEPALLSTLGGGAQLATNARHRAALLALGRALVAAGYDWVCPSPDTQALVNGRFPNRQAHDLSGVFGWSRPFSPELLSQPLPEALVGALRDAGVLQSASDGATLRSRVRFSSFAGTLVAHSAWPTHDADAVFFGPDTYRFGAFIERELHQPAAAHRHAGEHGRAHTVVDLGCGSGAGGILAARLLQTDADAVAHPVRLLFTDVNARALRFAAVNAELAGVPHFECRHSDVLANVPEPVDLVLAHPPGLLDPQERSYRHGGGELGTGLALHIVEQSLQRLAPGGRLLLYTTAPVVNGVDVLWRALRPLLSRAAVERNATHRYGLIDPDVSGAELAQPAYAQVERLSVMGLSVQMPLH